MPLAVFFLAALIAREHHERKLAQAVVEDVLIAALKRGQEPEAGKGTRVILWGMVANAPPASAFGHIDREVRQRGTFRFLTVCGKGKRRDKLRRPVPGEVRPLSVVEAKGFRLPLNYTFVTPFLHPLHLDYTMFTPICPRIFPKIVDRRQKKGHIQRSKAR
jgi:hypothetical protein